MNVENPLNKEEIKKGRLLLAKRILCYNLLALLIRNYKILVETAS